MSEQIYEVQLSRNEQARKIALESLSRVSLEPTGLVQYHSQGRVLVIGGVEALEVVPRLNGDLKPQVLLTDGVEKAGVEALRQDGRALRIEGYLGNFQVHLGEGDKANSETIKVDLILDLTPSPLIGLEMTPPGYLYADGQEGAIDEAIKTLFSLVGAFDKPLYFEYDPSICAHARSGHVACNRCIEACPAQAITGLAEAIKVDPNLCQGGGICATVCPGGAIQYRYPSPWDTQEKIATLLRTYREQGGIEPIVVLFTEADADYADFSQGNLLPVMLEELASVGMDLWLATLAFGARRLLLVDGESMPSKVRNTVLAELSTAHEIVQAMGYRADSIALVSKESLDKAPELTMPAFKPAGFYALKDKRQSLYMAIDHLYEQAGRAKPMVSLSAGAPFGTAQVDKQRCTLCMACVSACPGKALQSGQGEPKLKFIEANCLQCGMCTHTCPEDAIWISPRLLFERSARIKARVLCEDQPFNCTACGKPFATGAVVMRMLTKLQGHRMFQSERARNRLKMCEECRVIDAIGDTEAMENI